MTHPLINRPFHQWLDGAPEKQGIVIAIFASNRSDVGDLALVEWHEWLTGSATYQTLVPVAELTAEGRWSFYDNTQHITDYWHTFGKHKRKRADKKIADRVSPPVPGS